MDNTLGMRARTSKEGGKTGSGLGGQMTRLLGDLRSEHKLEKHIKEANSEIPFGKHRRTRREAALGEPGEVGSMDRPSRMERKTLDRQVQIPCRA